MAVQWGSVADWVSGFGSIAASGVALYLSGSERRARRDADRPVISCSLREGGGDGWVWVSISFDNPSPKQWRCTSIEVVKPRSGKIVTQYNATDRSKLANPHFSAVLRDEHARQTLDQMIDIGPVGSSAPTYEGGGRGNYTYRHYYATKSAGDPLVLRLRLESLEHVPDRYHVDVVR